MNKIKIGAFSVSLLAGTLALSNCGKSEKTLEKALVLSAIPDQKIANQEANYKALATYLEKKLNIKVKYADSKDYPAAVTRFANDEVHLMWFGGVTGVQARAKVEGSRAIAQGVVDPKYKSYFIAHNSTGLKKSDTFPKEIADFSFTFGSKSSTSGRVMPTYFIEQETGKQPKDFFKEAPQFRLQGSHTATATVVNEGSVKVGVLSYKTYDKLKAAGKLPNCDIIWKTPDYANYNFTAHPSLEKTFGEGFVDKLQQALVDCKDKQALSAIMREEGLIKAENKDFDGIKKVSQVLGFLR